MIRFHDTLTNQMIDFTPREEGKVSIYACGPTVYDVPHIGHARTALTYDVISRYLRWRGFEVTMVANITDIDDKIIARAAAENSTEPEIAATYEAAYIHELDRLGCAHPDHRTHATDFIPQMLEVIEELIAKGHAYVLDEAGVYFDIGSWESNYGRPKPGEPTWDSPWMPGRPGWHIECVAMALDVLGDGFDIHGGGTDLTFPHHENERAESEAAGHPFARYWIHSAMLNINGEKMSKSLNNFQTLGGIMDTWDPRALRLAMLQTHYRKVMELGDESMQAASTALERMDSFHRRVAALELGDTDDRIDASMTEFTDAMDHDFGAPAGVAVIFDLIRQGHSALDEADNAKAAMVSATVNELMGALGLAPPEAEEADEAVDALIAARAAAREAKDFAESDRIRDELKDMGIELEDGAAGTTWRRI